MNYVSLLLHVKQYESGVQREKPESRVARKAKSSSSGNVSRVLLVVITAPLNNQAISFQLNSTVNRDGLFGTILGLLQSCDQN